VKTWALVLLAGCTSGVRLEAERALSGGEHVRVITLDEQRLALAAFEGLACNDRDICAVKDACTKVARPTLAALEHRASAMPDVSLFKDQDAAADAAEAARARADALLARAHDELEAGKAAVPDCEAALAVLARSARNK
jgi:hypothetical protein